MPDLDIIDRKVARGWTPPIKMFVGTAKPTEVARAISKSLAKSLRENGGLLGFNQWIDLLEGRISGELDPHSAFVRAGVIERELEHGRHVKVAARAVRKILVEVNRWRMPGNDLRRILSAEFLWRLADHHFFGRIRPEVVGEKRFERVTDVKERERASRHALEPFVTKLAVSLARDPEALELRSPPLRSTRAATTESLLHRPIT